ncbi:tetratricopeptide repeat protein [Micromonospora sp. NPDC005215]|uniref:tetratricopeptide repeat protein n=1 Tax=Micromonospora sp. NPDC005215 TaxID=3157024 RepID=UPI0033A418AE
MSGLRRLLTGGRDAAAGVAVTGSLVIGDVIQVSDVAGSVQVTITPRVPPPYQLEPLPVQPPQLAQAKAWAQPSRLLLPRYRVVPFTGRDQQLSDLNAWAQGEAVAVRLVHAAGGQGKTRLAEEFATRRAGSGWTVWRAVHALTPRAGAVGVPAATGPGPVGPASRVALPAGGRVLAVVDYADRWPASHLLALLGDLHNIAVQTPVVLRVLLLARSVGFWWPAVTDRLDGDLDLDADDVPLPPLGADRDRADLYGTAARHFAAALGVRDASTWPPPPGLADPDFAQVLAVHMAALAAVDAHRHSTTAPTAPHAISAYLLRREYANWHQLHTRTEDPLPTPPQVLRRATYVATLTGALPRPAARTALTGVDLAASIQAADQIIDDHRTCTPPTDPGTVLEALHPDRLGEDLIALCTPGHPHTGADTAGLLDDWTLTAPTALLTTGDGTPPGWTPSTLTVLVETARRWPHIAANVLYPLIRQQPHLALAAGGATLTRLANLPDIDPTVLEAIEEHLPDDVHIDLDTAAAAITTTLTRHRLTTTTDPTDRAKLHARHAWRLNNAGRRDEALVPAVEATGIYQRLAEANPVAHLPDLARSLNNLGTLLSAVGRRDEALVMAEEAVAVRRRLAEVNRAAYLPDLAMSLNNLGTFLSKVGRRDEAVALAEEAVAVRRRLVEENPAAYLPDLGASLNNLGTFLSEVGRRDEALAPAEEATGIYRRLAEANPAAYLPDLAMSLNNLGISLSEVGDRDEALALAEEAVAIRRRLAEVNRAAYLPDLAMSLNNLGISLSEVGRRDEALAPAEEAVAIRRRLAEVNRAAYLPDLAMSLNNLGISLSEVGRRDEALAPAEEAMGIYRRLAEANPAAYLPDLAISLNNLGISLSEVGRRDEALAPAEEAVAIHRRLAEANPAAYRADLGASLNSLSIRLSEVGRRDEAVAPAEEAVSIHRRLAEANPTAYLPDLAGSLWRYAWVCVTIDRNLPKALAAVHEAIVLYEGLAEQVPQRFGDDLWSAYRTLADVLNGLGRTDEAIDLRRQLDEAETTTHRTRSRRDGS